MIVQYNVCDFCGEQKEIDESSSCGISIKFDISKIGDTRFRMTQVYKTFCGKECLLEYFKNYTDKDGILKKEDSSENSAE